MSKDEKNYRKINGLSYTREVIIIKKFILLQMTTMHSFDKYIYKVIETSPLDKSIHAVNLRPVGQGMKYLLGQFCEIICADRKGRYFSIVSNPAQLNNLEIHIRLTAESSRKFDELMTPQSIIELKGPFGKMHNILQLNNSKIFIAEGLGISAFYPFLNHGNQLSSEVHLIWIRRNSDREYLSKVIKRWEQTVRSFKSCIIEDTDGSLSEALKYCEKVILKNKSVILAFAGSSKISAYLQSDFIPKYRNGSVEFITDV